MKLVTKAILTLLTKKYKMKKFQIKMKNLKKKLKISICLIYDEHTFKN